MFDNVPEREPAALNVSYEDALEVYGHRLSEATKREAMATAANRAAMALVAEMRKELGEARARIIELETAAANAPVDGKVEPIKPEPKKAA
jgi:hypothetical protein